MTCAACSLATGLFDWGCDDCLTRFIVGLPDRDLRAGWLDRWTVQFGTERAEKIRAMVKDAWGKK